MKTIRTEYCVSWNVKRNDNRVCHYTRWYAERMYKDATEKYNSIAKRENVIYCCISKRELKEDTSVKRTMLNLK